MKTLFNTSWIFFLSLACFGANPVDSLVNQLANANTRSERLQALEQLTNANTDKDFEKVLLYGKEGFTLARELRQYKSMVNIGSKVIKAKLELNQHLEARTYFKEFDQLYTDERISPDDYARIVYLECHTSNLLEDYKALQISTEKLIDLDDKVSEKLRSRLKGFAYIFQSELAKNSKNYDRAEEFMLNKLKLNEEASDSNGMAATYFNLTTFNLEFNLDYSKAIQYAELGIKIAEKLNWQYLLSNLYVARFHAYVKLKDYTTAATQIDTVKQVIANSDRNLQKAQALLNIGEYYFGNQDYQTAIKHYKEGLKELDDNRENPLIIDFYKALRNAYSQIGDYANSYAFAEKELSLSDSLSNLEKIEAINYYQAKLDLVQEENKNEKLNDRLRRQSLYFLLIFLAILVAAYIIFQNIRTNRKLKKLNNQIAEDAKKLSKAYESLEFFSRSIYHDISSRVNLILSFSELKKNSLEKEPPGEFSEFVDLILKNAAFIKQFIIDIRTFSKMGSSENPPVEVDLNRITGLVLETLGTTIYEKQAALSIEDMPVIVGHETAIMQLFQNLIQNGIKYTKEGESPKIDISHKETDEHHIFHFENNGTPIPESAAERIFSPFVRLKRKNTVGSGLGLAICKRIVNHYEGDIWLEHSDENSTIFSVKFPK